MKIRKIELKHFKRFTDLIIDLGENPKKIVALVGPNGCGKSSIFDAFNFYINTHLGDKLHLGLSFFSKKEFLEMEDKTFNEQSIQIFDEMLNRIINDDKKSFYIRSAYRYASKFNIQSIRNIGNVLDDKERPGASIDLDRRLQENYERLISGFFEEVYDKNITGKNRVSENTKRINQILTNVLDIQISDLGNPTKNKGQLYFEKGVSKNFPYENLSSGEKEVIDIILDLIVKSKDYDNTIFCIDEPELHISTAIQKKLLIEIEKLIPDSCQLWIATHSIGFLRALQDVSIINKVQVLDFSDKNFDEKIELTPIILNRKNFKKIFETALDDLNGLLSPEIIVYCEGRIHPNGKTGEEKGTDAIIFNEIFSREFSNYYFISAGGNSEMDNHSELALVILQKAFIDSKILLFKDKDLNPDGVLTNDEQRAMELKQKYNLRILKRREIENYIFDFEILSKAYNQIQKTDYDTIISDIKEEDVKLKINELKTLCGVDQITKDNRMKELSRYVTEDTSVYTELKDALLNQ